MSWWLRSRARTRAILKKDALDRDLDRELSDWIDELTARYESTGLSRADARRRALADTGGAASIKRQVAEARPRWFFDPFLTEALRLDAMTACRSLSATPIPTLAAIVTVACAVGINLAMFGLVDRALLSPPAHVSEPSRVFTIAFHNEAMGAGARMISTSYPTYRTIRDRVPTLGGAAAFQRAGTSAIVNGDQRRITAMLVSSDYFDVLGAHPAIGRGLQIEDDQTGAASPVVVLSHAFWRETLGGRAGILGQRLSIRGVEYAITGVMPPGFSGHSSLNVDVWIPFASALRATPGWDRDIHRNLLSVVVRLAPGATAAAAATQATSAAGWSTSLEPIAGADLPTTERRVAWWLSAVAVLVWLIGLANAATLIVVRATKRQSEMIVRAALGASQSRLVSQAMLEALMLSAAAVVVSFIFASWMDEVIRRVLFPDLVARVTPARSSLAVALLAGLPAAIVAATANLWHLRSVQQPNGRRRAEGGRRSRTMTALLLVQTTVSVLLLAGAAMFAASLCKLAAQDFGMRMNGVVVVEFDRGPGGVAQEGQILARALEPIRALPGVDLVTTIDGLPFAGHNVPPIGVPGRADPPSVDGQLPFLNAATPEFMRILGIDVIQGRTFTAADDRGAPVVIVNDTMARGVWPGEDPIGQCIRIGFDPDFDPTTAMGPPMPSAALPCREVIGVAHDVRQRSLLPIENEAKLMQYFVPFSQIPRPPFAPHDSPIHGLLVRSDAPLDTLAPAIRRAIVGQRGDLPFVRVVPYAQLLDRQMRPWRLGTTLLAWFSALALGVAAIGLYAAFAHAVSERRREMAIRLAIGAQPADVKRLVLREALTLAMGGVILGCTAAAIAGRWAESLLFETTASDPLVVGSAAAGMLIVAVLATWLPARAASKADPSALLRVN